MLVKALWDKLGFVNMGSTNIIWLIDTFSLHRCEHSVSVMSKIFHHFVSNHLLQLWLCAVFWKLNSFHRLSPTESCPVKIIQCLWRHSVCHLRKTCSPGWGTMGRAEKQRAPRSDERLEGLLGSPLRVWLRDLFPPTGHWSPGRVDVPRWRLFPVRDGERGAGGREPCLCLCVRGKDTGRGCERLTCLQRTVRILSQGGGTALSRFSLPEYTQAHHRGVFGLEGS